MKKTAIKKLLLALEKVQKGRINLTTPDGKNYCFIGNESGLEASLQISNWRAIAHVFAKGDIGIAEAYRDGWIETDNLVHFLRFGVQNSDSLENYIYGGMVSKSISQLLYFLHRNTLRGSRRNIHAHYDLGNDFYSLWLDPTMTYSAGIFSSSEHSLEQAQHNKHDRIIERLNGRGGRLLEIGCGWGGFAERAHHKMDVALKGITLSDQQYQFAKNRLKNKAQIVKEDYRIQTGKYDHIISIEMFEAVGEKFWSAYFNKIKFLLNHNGKALIQTIAIADQQFDRYRKTGDMIRSFIFPGGMLPSRRRFQQEAERAGLGVVDAFSFGQDYATTLQCWLEAFENRLADIRQLGFDEKFIRIWRFYLSFCISGFKEKRADVYQFELQHD